MLPPETPLVDDISSQQGVNADGTGLTALTNATAAGALSFAPQWSPDGTRVVFESSRKLDGSDAGNGNGTSNIWRVNADGTGLTALTNATAASASSPQPHRSPSANIAPAASNRKPHGNA